MKGSSKVSGIYFKIVTVGKRFETFEVIIKNYVFQNAFVFLAIVLIALNQCNTAEASPRRKKPQEFETTYQTGQGQQGSSNNGFNVQPNRDHTHQHGSGGFSQTTRN